ncbi:MAG: PDZ domain-containing protein [Isosphaeraceae bacterium]
MRIWAVRAFPASSKVLGIVVASALVGAAAGSAWGVDTRDTRFLHEPALGGGRLVFGYADDLWTARPDGTDVRRLTAHPGVESAPYVSPDSKLVAFSGHYDGNVDVYVVPIEGGEPRRLTWHPGDDLVRGFTPDGRVLFASQRGVFTARFSQLFTVAPTGGAAHAERLPSADRGAVSPDGRFLAYTPLGERFRQWKNYRGGTATRIWIVDRETLEFEIIPQPDGRCNDTYPMWVGETVYFLSDRDGEFNLYAFDRKSKASTRLTQHDDHPIEAASAGEGMVVYERAGRLHRFDPASRRDEQLKLGVAADLVETRPRFARDLAKAVREADLSPNGRRAVLDVRGEIVTVPAKKGDPRNLSRTPGAHERSPVWSPDGRSLAYFSDSSGEYALIVRPADGQGEPRSYPLQGAGYYERLSWAPDSAHLAFTDNSRTLYVYDLEEKRQKKVGAEPVYGPVNTMTHAWSPDSKWLVYTLINRAYFQSVWLYSLADDKSHRITDGLADTGEPCFDSGGKWLYFLASTDAGPVRQWFDQSNADMQATASIFLAVLDPSTKNPLARPDDQEAADDSAKGSEASGSADAASDKTNKEGPKAKDGHPPTPAGGGKEKPKPPRTVVDLDGLDRRIVALPVPAGNLSNLVPGPGGTIYYLRRVGYVPGRSGEAFEGTASVVRFSLESREEEILAEKVDGFRLSANGKSILYRAKETIGIVDSGKFKVGDGKLALDRISIQVEPRAEWPQIAREAWRINRDFFYDPAHHGADWSAIWSKYEPWIADCPTRGDLNRVIRAMLSELSVGHSYLGGGERVYEPRNVPVGLLGADFEVADGRYRFKTIYGGANWDPALTAPLVAPGVDVKVGDLLLSVDGEDVRTTDDVYRFFENKVGRKVELKVGRDPNGKDARTVTVEPIASEAALRNREWVESNLKKVRAKTAGKVAYVYVPNTAELGHAYFKRYFFPQVESQAIIIDERFNGGGSVADYYIDMLRRPVVSYWATRHGEPTRTPGAAILGPKVMLIDETAGSGGDLLPWMFRRFKLGTLVGRRTWGGLVGILGFPPLMDGGSVTAPDLAFYTDEGWRVENEGVPPDVEVEQSPAEVAKGNDPQLDRAIAIALKELETHPPRSLPRPEFPIRVRPRPGARAPASPK